VVAEIKPGIRLTLESVQVRALSVPMQRPIVSKVGGYPEWPFILIDVKTREGVVGRSYLEPYVHKSVGAITAVIGNIAEQFKGKPIAPLDVYGDAMKTLHLNGREGITLIALSGLDMAIWDALARAAGLPLASLLGGSPGPVRAYNTNGLWLIPKDKLAAEAKSLVAEGGFKAIKMRLGRPTLKDDIEAIRIVRDAVGDDILLMSDFNQGLPFGEALLRMHGLDDQGLYWFEEPVTYDNLDGCAQLAREVKTPVQIGENIYGPREFLKAVNARAADLYMPDLMRIGGVTGWMPSPAPLACPCPATCTRRSRRNCCASANRPTGWSGATGPSRSSPSPSPRRTATPPSPTRRAMAWRGTRRR
jgi:mandelate racemase